ncbi:NAD(P)-binding domain-containing protein [Actinoplanes sp. NPDC051851]|uniref:NADPH-dependent F420 reductase n=1 Tax=Actinoplanes sp. NPDC051851 TaxID=3154753 RepID=UPI003446409C
MASPALGIIGSGMIGGTVARLAAAAGIDVVIGNSRGPDTLGELVDSVGPRARAATAAEAASTGLVVVAVPLHAYDRLPVAEVSGGVVVDAMNYYPERDGHIGALDGGELTSSELVQRQLTGATVVKAFNNIDFRRLGTLARPAGAGDRSALPVAGDDGAATARVVELLDRLGYDAVELGTLADSWRSRPGTPVYVQPYFPGEPPAGQDRRTWFFETPGVAVPAARVRELLATAVR